MQTKLHKCADCGAVIPEPFDQALVHRPIRGACDACVAAYEAGLAKLRRIHVAKAAAFLPRMPQETFGVAGVDYDMVNAPIVARLSKLTRSAGNLWLCGPPGTGKTHSACCVGHRAIAAGIPAGLVSARQVVKAGEHYDEQKTQISRWKSTPVLVLDDFDKIPVRESAIATLWEFLNDRYGKLTIVTSNPDPGTLCDDWIERVGNASLVTATFDRLQPCTTFTFGGESLRKKAGAETCKSARFSPEICRVEHPPASLSLLPPKENPA